MTGVQTCALPIFTGYVALAVFICPSLEWLFQQDGIVKIGTIFIIATEMLSIIENVKEFVGEDRSTYNLFLPEAYLDTVYEEKHNLAIMSSMNEYTKWLTQYKNSMVYIERSLPEGGIRKGLIGKIDLEQFNYYSGSKSLVRSSEKTVVSRIPAREKIRAKAIIELPHIMVFADDKKIKLIEKISLYKNRMKKLYDFDLMFGGGNIKGYIVENDVLDDVKKLIADYEKDKESTGIVYAVGDGNHSLAAAKSFYDKAIKQNDFSLSRYALAEIVSLYDDSIKFEPIYRIVKECDVNVLVDTFLKYCKENTKGNCIKNGSVIFNNTSVPFSIHINDYDISVGYIQKFIDDFLENNKGQCDYIHGIESLKTLSSQSGCVGFLFDGIRKEELFNYIVKKGNLPRKTFSMGSAKSKRYYIESRRIKTL